MSYAHSTAQKGGDKMKKLMSLFVAILFALSLAGFALAEESATPETPAKTEQKAPAKAKKKAAPKKKKAAKKAKKTEKKSEEAAPAPESK